MEIKRISNTKNFILLLITLLLSNISYTNSTSVKELENSKSLHTPENQIVKSIDAKFSFDKEKDSCNIYNLSETVKFSFNKPTNVLTHLVFTKKFSFYNFRVHIFEKNLGKIEGLKIEKVKTFSNTSIRKNILNSVLNQEIGRNAFKENWLIMITLSKPVEEIELEFFYNLTHAMKVDPLIKTNTLQYEYINPYAYKIDQFSLRVKILNYNNLNKYSIKTPDEGTITDIDGGRGIKISLKKSLPEMSLYSINLPLPYEIDMCNKGFFNMISITLFFMTFLITGFGLFTCFKISKD